VRVKLAENLGNRGAEGFRSAGHDVATAYEQRLTSATDDQLFAACQRESRLLVSLDLDFAIRLRFDPKGGAGIAILRVRGEPTRVELAEAVGTLVNALAHAGPAGHLGVVEATRVPRYEADVT
jgi:predicted nuclease of predicted toxin-antitoxin system